MGTTQYFGEIADLGRQYYDIKKDYDAVLQVGFSLLGSVLARMPHAKLDEDGLQDAWDITDRFRKHVKTLKAVRGDVSRINAEVGERSGGGKHGSLKKKLAQTLTVDQVLSLREEMKEAVCVMEKVSERDELDPYVDFLKSRPDAPKIESNGATQL